MPAWRQHNVLNRPNKGSIVVKEPGLFSHMICVHSSKGGFSMPRLAVPKLNEKDDGLSHP